MTQHVHPDQTKKHILPLRLSQAEHEKLKRHALSVSLPLAAWARSTLIAQIPEEKTSAPEGGNRK